ncbi:hypothetical protein JOE31_001702 [Arthrobacter sp. PvP023]|nr:hypothetical protein [Arthrobacter sp. PvP023]
MTAIFLRAKSASNVIYSCPGHQHVLTRSS